MSVVPPTTASSVSPCLSRQDRTSPWPVTPSAGRFDDATGLPPASVSSSSRYVQPQLLHYLVQQHHPASSGHSSRRPSPAAGSNCQPSSPSCSSMFYHVDNGKPSVTQQPASRPTGHSASASPTSYSSAARWTDWRCGLRPSGAVSFRAVVDGDDSRSSVTEDRYIYQPHQTTHEAKRYQHSRLI